MQIGDKVRLLKDCETINTRITFQKDEILTIKAYDGEYWYTLENESGNIIKTGKGYFEKVIDKFNWKLILQPNTVVHCDTEAKANSLLADSRGLKWCTGESYKNITDWDEYEDETCYDLYVGEFGTYPSYKENNYTILTYEDVLLKGENKMKRIDNDYEKDGLTVTYTKYHVKIEKDINGHMLFKLTIGESNLTFEQANEMLKPFGIIIEPKKITDWSKVEVGSYVYKLSKLWGEPYYELKFYDYIPSTKQILVMENNYVRIYKEDEVELV